MELKKVGRLLCEGGIRAMISLILAEAIFIGLALVAGIIGWLLGDWTSGLIGVVAALFLLNYIALLDVIFWIYQKLEQQS